MGKRSSRDLCCQAHVAGAQHGALTSSVPACCRLGQASKQPGLLLTWVGSVIDSRDASALQVSAYSPLAGGVGTRKCPRCPLFTLRAVSKAWVLVHPVPSLLTAEPMQLAQMSVQSPSQTSHITSPALEGASSSTALALAHLPAQSHCFSSFGAEGKPLGWEKNGKW